MKPNFCSACGAKLNDGPAFCPSCGVAIQSQSATNVTATEYRVPPVLSSGAIANGHSKVTAVLLTLFFGGFGLLYTVRDKGDFGKFLASLSFGPEFSLLGLALLVVSMGTGEPAGLITGFLFMLFGMFFWSVLPLLTTAMRTQAWYDDYDRKHGAH
jgi:predicted RNA-binding Zn-ribbon protein involved in translation (DUF1610 family)